MNFITSIPFMIRFRVGLYVKMSSLMCFNHKAIF
ncbi:hypothetical protein SAMN05216516_11035 [Izhakiella capsodis]|uniref:Uncharacterized protein n=1 Tax=Izhakiella capsodis TaxID=1367852 RepID=A0A1I4ZXF5_9GAMM|nr:hypothetical protein SAMN05216516_11035 [Izhakiella capsodis]